MSEEEMSVNGVRCIVELSHLGNTCDPKGVPELKLALQIVHDSLHDAGT